MKDKTIKTIFGLSLLLPFATIFTYILIMFLLDEFHWDCYVIHGCTSTSEEILFCFVLNAFIMLLVIALFFSYVYAYTKFRKEVK